MSKKNHSLGQVAQLRAKEEKEEVKATTPEAEAITPETTAALTDEQLFDLLHTRGLTDKVVSNFIDKATPRTLNGLQQRAKTQKETLLKPIDEKIKALWEKGKETLASEDFIKAIIEVFLLTESDKGTKSMNFSNQAIRRYIEPGWDVDISYAFHVKRVKQSKTPGAQGAKDITEAEAEAKTE